MIDVLTSQDKEKWNRYLTQSGIRDIYYAWEYSRLFELNGDGQARLFVYNWNDKLVLYPHLLRSVQELPAFRTLAMDQEYFDIITPYGYGGPVTNADDPDERTEIMRRFAAAFAEYCSENGIIAELVRYHPLLKNYEYNAHMSNRFVKHTIQVDLRPNYEQIAANYTSECRNRIRKASRSLTVSIRRAGDAQRFRELYEQSMDRLNADLYYYFSDPFYHFLTSANMEHLVRYVEVFHESRLIVSAIFFCFGDYIHYFLLGSDNRYWELAPNNLLFDSIIHWGKLNGYRFLHLGAGHHIDDSLYRFKKSFNKNGALAYHFGQKIHNEAIYSELESYVRKNFPSTVSDHMFFPSYRQPAYHQ